MNIEDAIKICYPTRNSTEVIARANAGEFTRLADAVAEIAKVVRCEELRKELWKSLDDLLDNFDLFLCDYCGQVRPYCRREGRELKTCERCHAPDDDHHAEWQREREKQFMETVKKAGL